MTSEQQTLDFLSVGAPGGRGGNGFPGESRPVGDGCPGGDGQVGGNGAAADVVNVSLEGPVLEKIRIGSIGGAGGDGGDGGNGGDGKDCYLTIKNQQGHPLFLEVGNPPISVTVEGQRFEMECPGGGGQGGVGGIGGAAASGGKSGASGQRGKPGIPGKIVVNVG